MSKGVLPEISFACWLWRDLYERYALTTNIVAAYDHFGKGRIWMLESHCLYTLESPSDRVKEGYT